MLNVGIDFVDIGQELENDIHLFFTRGHPSGWQKAQKATRRIARVVCTLNCVESVWRTSAACRAAMDHI
jgi:hypothetical protein